MISKLDDYKDILQGIKDEVGALIEDDGNIRECNEATVQILWAKQDDYELLALHAMIQDGEVPLATKGEALMLFLKELTGANQDSRDEIANFIYGYLEV